MQNNSVFYLKTHADVLSALQKCCCGPELRDNVDNAIVTAFNCHPNVFYLLDSVYSRDGNEELAMRNFIILTYTSRNIDHQELIFSSVIIFVATICLDLMIIVEALMHQVLVTVQSILF